jgi:hypothetical protein
MIVTSKTKFTPVEITLETEAELAIVTALLGALDPASAKHIHPAGSGNYGGIVTSHGYRELRKLCERYDLEYGLVGVETRLHGALS